MLLTSNIQEVNGDSAHSFNGTQRHPIILMARTRDLVHSPSSLKVCAIKFRLPNTLMFFYVLKEPLSHSLGLHPHLPFPGPNLPLLVSIEGRLITLPMGLKPSLSHPLKPTFSGTNPQHWLTAITSSLFHISQEWLTWPLSWLVQTLHYRAKCSSQIMITLQSNILGLGQEIRILSIRGLFKMASQ